MTVAPVPQRLLLVGVALAYASLWLLMLTRRRPRS